MDSITQLKTTHFRDAKFRAISVGTLKTNLVHALAFQLVCCVIPYIYIPTGQFSHTVGYSSLFSDYQFSFPFCSFHRNMLVAPLGRMLAVGMLRGYHFRIISMGQSVNLSFSESILKLREQREKIRTETIAKALSVQSIGTTRHSQSQHRRHRALVLGNGDSQLSDWNNQEEPSIDNGQLGVVCPRYHLQNKKHGSYSSDFSFLKTTNVVLSHRDDFLQKFSLFKFDGPSGCALSSPISTAQWTTNLFVFLALLLHVPTEFFLRLIENPWAELFGDC